MMHDLLRRLMMIVAPGKVAASTDTHSALGLTIQIGPYERRENVPQLGLHGVVSHPLPGADVLVLHIGGDRSNPVVLAVNDQVRRMKGTAPGDAGLAHHLGASVMLYADRVEVIGGGRPVIFKGASKYRFEDAPIECTHEVTALADGAFVHLSTHQTTNVQSGGGLSGPPKPSS